METPVNPVPADRISVIVLRMLSVAFIAGWFMQYTSDYVALPLLFMAVVCATFSTLVRMAEYIISAARIVIAKIRVLYARTYKA